MHPSSWLSGQRGAHRCSFKHKWIDLPVRPRLASLFFTLASLACGAPDAAAPVVRRDSVGIEIVTNRAPEWTEVTAWSLTARPVLDVGGDSTAPLYRIQALRALQNGVAVLNAGSSEILLFHFDGTLGWRAGGRGGGPREFSRLTDLYRCAGDTLLVNDFTRITTLDSSGRFIRSEPLVPNANEQPLRVRGVDAACRPMLLSSGQTSDPPAGQTGRRRMGLMWGSLSGGPRDTIGTFPTQEVVPTLIDGVPQALPVPWGADGVWATGPGRLYYGSTDQAEIRMFDREAGLTRIVRWPETERRVTSEDHELYASNRTWLLGLVPPLADALPTLGESSASDFVPMFRSFLVDGEGNLWVRRYPRFLAGRPDLYDLDVPLRYTPPAGTEPEVWLVFAQTGRWLGEVRTPRDLSVRAVGDSLVIGVWHDAEDVEHVRAYRLQKPK